MFYRVLLFGTLITCSFANANINPEPISPQIDSYVKSQLDFGKIKKSCDDYGYNLLRVKTDKRSNGVIIVDWMVVDHIGDKLDQRFFSFQTTNLEVTAKFQALNKPSDWEANLAECKNT